MSDGGEAMAMAGGRTNETAMGSSSLYEWHTENPYDMYSLQSYLI